MGTCFSFHRCQRVGRYTYVHLPVPPPPKRQLNPPVIRLGYDQIKHAINYVMIILNTHVNFLFLRIQNGKEQNGKDVVSHFFLGTYCFKIKHLTKLRLTLRTNLKHPDSYHPLH